MADGAVAATAEPGPSAFMLLGREKILALKVAKQWRHFARDPLRVLAVKRLLRQSLTQRLFRDWRRLFEDERRLLSMDQWHQRRALGSVLVALKGYRTRSRHGDPDPSQRHCDSLMLRAAMELWRDLLKRRSVARVRDAAYML